MDRPHAEGGSEEPFENLHRDYTTTYTAAYSEIFTSYDPSCSPTDVDGAISIFNSLAERIMNAHGDIDAYCQALRDLNDAAEASMYRVKELTDTINHCAAEITLLEEEFEQYRKGTRELEDEFEAQKAELHTMTKKYMDSISRLDKVDANMYQKELMLRTRAQFLEEEIEMLQCINSRLRGECLTHKEAPAPSSECLQISGQELFSLNEMLEALPPTGLGEGTLNAGRCFGGDVGDPRRPASNHHGKEEPSSSDGDGWVAVGEAAAHGQPETAGNQYIRDLYTVEGAAKYLTARCVRLSMLPPDMNTGMLSRIVRGGRIEYMRVRPGTLVGTCKALVFFLSEASAKAFHDWVTYPPKLTVNGSEIQSELVTVNAAPPPLTQNCETRVLVVRVPSGTSITAAAQRIQLISVRHKLHIRLQSAQTWVDSDGVTYARYVFEGSAMASLVLKAIQLAGADPNEAGYSYDECEDKLWDVKAWNFSPG